MASGSIIDTRFRLTDQESEEIAEKFGTPTYVISESHFRSKCKEFRASWPGDISFASKSNTTQALLKIAYQEGLFIDSAGEGELRMALAAGVPAISCRLHGNNKSMAELKFAHEVGVGIIIVDCFEEIDKLIELRSQTNLLLRVAPGVNPNTNIKISTGQADTKFGFSLETVLDALKMCLNHGLQVKGFHCHVGSQLMSSESQVGGALALAELAQKAQSELGFRATLINVGGGLGVRYTSEDNPMGVKEYCADILNSVVSIFGTDALPHLEMEPGRALVAESGVTLYRVGVVKVAGSGRKYVSVDGGLSDNPRPALYGSKYEVVWVNKSDRSEVVRVSGKHCETDMLFDDVPAPKDLVAGELVQVLTTGAYNMVMASNYNGYPRPASVLVREDGRHDLVQRRETWEQVLSRDVMPRDL